MLEAFQVSKAEGLTFVYENRVVVTTYLVKRCLKTVPGMDDFFVPQYSFLSVGPRSIFTMMKRASEASPDTGTRQTDFHGVDGFLLWRSKDVKGFELWN